MTQTEIADEVVKQLAERNIKSKWRKSKKSKSIYVIVKNMPEIRISDHISKTGIKQFSYNIIFGDKSMMSNTTTIYIRKSNKPVFYYSPNDIEKLINSYEVLYKKRNLT